MVMLQHKSLHGLDLSLGKKRGNLYARGIPITREAVTGTVITSAKVSNVRTVTVQLTDAKGNKIDYAETVDLIAYLDAAGVDFAVTGGSTGIAASTAGKVLQVVAKKVFKATTDITGKLIFIVTDTASEVFFIGIVLPSGRVLFTTTMA